MLLVVWGVDEVFEAIGLIYAVVIGLVFLLVSLEGGLYSDPSQPGKHGRSGQQSTTPADRSPEDQRGSRA